MSSYYGRSVCRSLMTSFPRKKNIFLFKIWRSLLVLCKQGRLALARLNGKLFKGKNLIRRRVCKEDGWIHKAAAGGLERSRRAYFCCKIELETIIRGRWINYFFWKFSYMITVNWEINDWNDVQYRDLWGLVVLGWGRGIQLRGRRPASPGWTSSGGRTRSPFEIFAAISK